MLSERDGAAFVGEYREQGYLPEALFNYLLLLGWNPGDDREVLTREERIKLFDEKAVAKRLAKDGVKATLLDLVERFSKIADWTAPNLEAVVKELSQGQGMGPWVHPIRVAVSGRGEGIGIFEMLQLLGKEKTLARLRSAAEKFCK